MEEEQPVDFVFEDNEEEFVHMSSIDIDYSDPIKIENLRSHLVQKYEKDCHGTRQISSSRKQKRNVSSTPRGIPTNLAHSNSANKKSLHEMLTASQSQLKKASQTSLASSQAAATVTAAAAVDRQKETQKKPKSAAPVIQQIQIVQLRPSRRQREMFTLSNTVPIGTVRAEIAQKCLINEAFLSPMLMNCTAASIAPTKPSSAHLSSTARAPQSGRKHQDLIDYSIDKISRMYNISGQIELNSFRDRLNSARGSLSSVAGVASATDRAISSRGDSGRKQFQQQQQQQQPHSARTGYRPATIKATPQRLEENVEKVDDYEDDSDSDAAVEECHSSKVQIVVNTPRNPNQLSHNVSQSSHSSKLKVFQHIQQQQQGNKGSPHEINEDSNYYYHPQGEQSEQSNSSSPRHKAYRYTEAKRHEHQSIKNSGLYLRNQPYYLSDPECKAFEELNKGYKPVNIANIEGSSVKENQPREGLMSRHVGLLHNFKEQFNESKDQVAREQLEMQAYVQSLKHTDYQPGDSKKMLDNDSNNILITSRRGSSQSKHSSYQRIKNHGHTNEERNQSSSKNKSNSNNSDQEMVLFARQTGRSNSSSSGNEIEGSILFNQQNRSNSNSSSRSRGGRMGGFSSTLLLFGNKKPMLTSPCLYLNRNDRVRFNVKIPEVEKPQVNSHQTVQLYQDEQQQVGRESSKGQQKQLNPSQMIVYFDNFGQQELEFGQQQQQQSEILAGNYSKQKQKQLQEEFEDPREKYLRKQQMVNEIVSLAAAAAAASASAHNALKSPEKNKQQSRASGSLQNRQQGAATLNLQVNNNRSSSKSILNSSTIGGTVGEKRKSRAKIVPPAALAVTVAETIHTTRNLEEQLAKNNRSFSFINQVEKQQQQQQQPTSEEQRDHKHLRKKIQMQGFIFK